ncbi:MAG: VOC family protein [Verrucomicrobiaceae bacterium]|nr:MAG: VOC family protein [Verrucomicrobiaceae bacterium]
MSTETKNPPASSSANPVPNGMRTVTPHLVCAGAADAMEFYKKAFGATENMRLAGPDGKLMHGCISIGDSMVMLVDEMPDCGCMGPKSIGGSAVTIHLQVEDADALYDQAVKAGATATMPVADMFWGDRYGIVTDPFGHNWSIATHVRDLTPEEIQEAAKNACCGQ